MQCLHEISIVKLRKIILGMNKKCCQKPRVQGKIPSLMVTRLITNSKLLLYQRQTNILSAAIIMMVLMLTSKVLGLLRNRALAAQFGAGAELDIYVTAFVIPDFIANLLIVGTLSTAFIPVFSSYLTKNKQEEAWKLASSLLNLSLLFFAFFGMLVFIFASNVADFLLVPPTQRGDFIFLSRMIIVSELFLIGGSFLSSILQSFHRFIIPALAPVLYNLGTILGIIFLSPQLGIKGVVIGLLLGAFLHFLIQLPLTKSLGFQYRSFLDFKISGMKEIIKLSLPRAVSVGFGQMEWAASVFFANLLSPGSPAILRFAFDLQNFPISLFGLTIATASLPTLSTEWAKKNVEQFKTTFISSLSQILYFAAPLSVILIVLRIPVVRLVLGAGKFDWTDTVSTAMTLSYFSLGIATYAGFLLIARAFYAMQDTLTPVKVTGLSLIIYLSLSLYFVTNFDEVAFLGVAASVSSIFAFIVSFLILDKKVGGFDRAKLILPSLKIFLATIAMGLSIYIPVKLLDSIIIDTTRTINLILLTSFVTLVGFTIYFLLTWWLKLEEHKIFLKLINKTRNWKNVLVPPATIQNPPTQ